MCSPSPAILALLAASLEVLYFGFHKCSLQFFLITVMLPVLFPSSITWVFEKQKVVIGGQVWKLQRMQDNLCSSCANKAEFIMDEPITGKLFHHILFFTVFRLL